ncbi:MAG: S41 family peptidase, partial [Gemmatimonadales bacterium]
TRVFPHTPGAEAGVERGDRIVTVEGVSIEGWPLGDITEKLKGEPGTRVKVQFVRGGVKQPLDVQLTRAVIHIPSVPYAILLDGGTGYLPLQQITETSATEVRSAIENLAEQGMTSLVLDLRGNGGGYTDQALQVANFFLPRGSEIYSVQSRDPDPDRYFAARDPLVPDLPLIVLTDAYSASAAEIIAGALQDHDRALLVGNTSFGKGLVQSVFPLDNGWALKLTTGKWYTPSGRSIQRPDRDVGIHQAMEGDTIPLEERPVYHSDQGRVIYGGGAITPDVLVDSDTLTAAEQTLSRALAPYGQDVNLALLDLARDLQTTVAPGFTMVPAWRERLWNSLQDRGVEIERMKFDAGSAIVDYLIENRVAVLAFGDSAAKRRAV